MRIVLDVSVALGFGEAHGLPVRDASIFPPMTWQIGLIFILLDNIANILPANQRLACLTSIISLFLVNAARVITLDIRRHELRRDQLEALTGYDIKGDDSTPQCWYL